MLEKNWVQASDRKGDLVYLNLALATCLLRRGTGTAVVWAGAGSTELIVKEPPEELLAQLRPPSRREK